MIRDMRSRLWKISLGNLFASYFLWKIENPPYNHTISKYVAGKEIRTGPTESRGIIKV